MSKKIIIDNDKINTQREKSSSFSYTNDMNVSEMRKTMRPAVDSDIEKIRQKSIEFKNKRKNLFSRNSTVSNNENSNYNPIEFVSPLGKRTLKKTSEDNIKDEQILKLKLNRNKEKIISKKIILDQRLTNKINDSEVVYEQKKSIIVNSPVNNEIYKQAEKEIAKDNELDIDLSIPESSNQDYNDIYLFDEEQIKVYESFSSKMRQKVSSNDYLVRKTSLIESNRDHTDPFKYFSDEKGLVLSNNTSVIYPEIMPEIITKQPELIKIEEDVKHYSGNMEEEMLVARQNKKVNEKIISSHATSIIDKNMENTIKASENSISSVINTKYYKQPEKVKTVPQQKEVATKTLKNYTLPSINLLDSISVQNTSNEGLQEKIEQLETFFKNFKIEARVENSTIGPTVARFELSIAAGTKVSKISNLKDDIKLALASKDVRIEAPIPGKNLIGIEIPAMKSRTIKIKEILQTPKFKQSSNLSAALGVSIDNIPTLLDVASMPHGLISGSTGSGKSVSINALLVSLLYKNTPDEMKLILVDPKVVELSPYNGIPHLLSPVISDPKEALNSLKWAASEMDKRYTMFSKTNTRNLEAYNKIAEVKMPKIVIVIDELADLMMVASNDVELYITRIAQKSRAAGIHMILATQRPSVEVITGLIKANIPTRVAFAVSSSIDSRTILDQIGAETLLGRGDMLFSERGKSPIRLQAPFITDDEINNVISHWQQYSTQGTVDFKYEEKEASENGNKIKFDNDFINVAEFVIESKRASTSLVQRKFSFGYNKAARIIDNLEDLGIIGPQNGTKPREVNFSIEQFEQLREENERN